MADLTDSEFWTEQRAAAYLGLAAITLKIWRSKGKPFAPYYRFGKRIMYRAADVRSQADGQRQTEKVAP